MQCMRCGTTLQPTMSVCPTCGAPTAYSENTAAGFSGNEQKTLAASASYQESLPTILSDRTLPAAPAAGPAGSYPPGVRGSSYPPAGAALPPSYSYGPPPPAPPQPPGETRRHGLSRGIIVVLAALVVLMMIGGGILYYFSGPYPAMLHANAMATAQAQADANATGTAVVIHNANATATAQVQATLTAQQTIYTQATSGNPVLSDSLAQNSASHWDEYDSAANAGCVFSGGTYHAIQQQTGYFNPCFASVPTFGNFTFQVQMTILKGDQGGMIFRASNQNFRGYLLVIGADQSYGLYVYHSSSGSNAPAVFAGASPIINGRNQQNLVTIIVRGSQITLFINKHYVDSGSDGTYKSGQIALLAESQNNATEVAYSNAQVWSL